MFKNKYLILLILIPVLLTISGCKDSPQRHLKLGNWYFQKGLMDEAVLEYREVTRLLPTDAGNLSRDDFETLAKAHYSLALVYTKKGWYDYALSEAETCFKLIPTKENYDLVQLIKKRVALGELSAES
ncbi:MAG: hypothetical protein ABIA75_14230 [Candidatus Neomarinimicrobiota bacterium]